jgi:hypothetical protein
MPRPIRALPVIATLFAVFAANAAPATASSRQLAMFEDDIQLRSDPAGAVAALRELGVSNVRLSINWQNIAPDPHSHHKPHGFHGQDPAAYPASSWVRYDSIMWHAAKAGISVGIMVTGPGPEWAVGPGEPKGAPPGIWKPSPASYGAFVQALATRYSGHYKPAGATEVLPRVSIWSIWNEPNYGVDLAPQATNNDTIEVGAAWYRKLVDAGWSALGRARHGGDTILIGETAPRGLDHPIGNFSGTKPLRFLRALYCVDSRFRQLRGSAASARGCPTTSAGSRKFSSDHPGLFKASGFADHPYAQGFSPVTPTYACGHSACAGHGRSDPDYADFPEIPRLERTLDRLNSVYGSHSHFPIYNTEYGYWTKPPDPHATISPKTASYWINWAEYLSWKQGRVASYDQYLLVDPPANNFASGLEMFRTHKHKATYDAYRMPLYLPQTRGRKLEVWGCVRPAHFAQVDTHSTQHVKIQFRAGKHGSWKTVKTVAVSDGRGYFDEHVSFPGSGSVRLEWSYPSGGGTIHSRIVDVTG